MVDLYIHVMLLFALLTLLFVFYGSGVETTETKNKFSDAMQSAVDSVDPATIAVVLSPANVSVLRQLRMLYAKPDEAVAEHNLWVKALPFIILAVLAMLLGTAYFATAPARRVELSPIFKENLVILAFVAVFEFAFFKLIVLQYSPSLPSALKSEFRQSVLDYRP